MEPIGRGTYGAVYRGTCAGQDVAVKVLPLQTNTAEDIKREIQLMRHCSCVNIVEVSPSPHPSPHLGPSPSLALT
jgi:serine/threonine protein kinase